MNPKIVDTLAENVRRLRERSGLSLAALADRSGVAKATLYKVERGRTNPTIETVEAIADSFKISVSSLIEPSDDRRMVVVRKGDGENISDDSSTGFILGRQAIASGTIEIHSVTFLDGRGETSASHGVGSREHVLVTSGSIEVGPVGQEVRLEKGDYATYSADRAHRWQSIDGPASVVIMLAFASAL
ncbi:MAG: XRE family transcriptional regulator [Actinomycetota bacterium]|nr:XRE family transcriptional regulator [Actinomycetota bacterium]